MSHKVFFTSDNHFGHKGIIEYSERPFATVDDMDEFMIERWNEVVGPHDRIYHVGDFSFRKKDETYDILNRLNGIKYLLKGNHDRLSRMAMEHWQWVKDYFELKVGTQKIILCHYPFETWNKAHYGAWHLHGHSHGSLKNLRGGRLDVGVDFSWTNRHPKFVPWSFEEIEEYMKNFDYNLCPADHHKSRPR